MRGWAFIRGKSSLNNIKIVLTHVGKNKSYFIGTYTTKRPDVTQKLGNGEYNLDNTGFNVSFKKNSLGLAKGKYEIGLYIEDGKQYALQYINKSIFIK